MEDSEIRFILPFKGTWATFWGGDTPKQNHHHGNRVQKYAFDFIKTDGDSFGETIYAPADGYVVEAVDGLRDNPTGNMNTYNVFGNYIMIKHDERTYSVLCHLKQGSVMVKAGDTVKFGDKIAQCGNSGNTTEPHLHFHVQDSPVFARIDDDYNQIDIACGKKAFFQNTIVNGNFKADYSPVKGDTVRNQK